MITRIYIHNFRTLVDFTVKLSEINLFMGPNGCGKTSVFDAVRLLQSFLRGDCRVDKAFEKRDITCWAQKSEMRIELDLSLPEGDFTYAIHIEYVNYENDCLIKEESLYVDGKPLFQREQNYVQTYTDDHVAESPFPVGLSLSALVMIAVSPDTKKLAAFKYQTGLLVVAGINPFAMEANSREEDQTLDNDMRNFTSWYRKLMAKNPEKVGDVVKALRNGPMPDFLYYSFDDAGQDVKTFNVHFSAPNASDYKMNFGRLSAGQKVLIVLYILMFGVKGDGICLFLDEPENFVMLREIQPWLAEFRDVHGTAFRQLTLISHHPHVIDEVGVSDSQWFFRDNGGATQLKDYTPILDDSPLALSEHVAMGNFE